MKNVKVTPFASPPETEKAASGGKDRLFDEPRPMAEDFRFDDRTATVFDDMVSRSVPFYAEIQRMVGEMVADFAVPGTNLYDLGCATGTTLLGLDPLVDPQVKFIGIDNSSDMLDQARLKLAARRMNRSCELLVADLNDYGSIDGASVVAMILTLQFIRPLRRQKILERIAQGLLPNGCLLLVEKLTVPNSLINRLYVKYYYALKERRGYSQVEISQKREALENVLIPYRFEENRELLLQAGFSQVEEFFRWYNFCGILAVK